MSAPADFVVLHTDGTASWGCGDVDSIMDALGVDRAFLDVSGAGRIQLWHTEASADPNPLSERVLTRLGYRHPAGWNGPIALTTRALGRMDLAAPLAADVCETVQELATAPSDDAATPAGSFTTTMIDAALPPGPDSGLAGDRVPAEPDMPQMPEAGVDL
ncbi:hypothetical protein [Nocardia brasiliensis]|uniref:hypothetical protein n=1 Tax=Nocardia brasiliensis TaxID=37326 RepID=UPI0024552DCB|nr:hypothetical protein [Nocardia brasiliensis]